MDEQKKKKTEVTCNLEEEEEDWNNSAPRTADVEATRCIFFYFLACEFSAFWKCIGKGEVKNIVPRPGIKA